MLFTEYPHIYIIANEINTKNYEKFSKKIVIANDKLLRRLFSNKKSDNCCLLKDDRVVIVDNIFKENGEIYFRGRCYVKTVPFFETLCDSRILNIYKCFISDKMLNITFKIADIKKKCFVIKANDNDNSNVVMPQLHTNEFHK